MIYSVGKFSTSVTKILQPMVTLLISGLGTCFIISSVSFPSLISSAVAVNLITGISVLDEILKRTINQK